MDLQTKESKHILTNQNISTRKAKLAVNMFLK